jgi:anti-sigma regulatory factor (Ser/Thr protein kinase)
MVPAARAFVRAFLGGHPLARDAELIASEYVTNAIRHTASGDGGVIHVTVAATPVAVRIEVTDHGQASPSPAAAAPDAVLAAPGAVPAAPGAAPGATVAPSPQRGGSVGEDENGRGLLIVDFLATRWGHYGLAGGQVTAWAELGEAAHGGLGEGEPGEGAPGEAGGGNS